MDIKVLAYTANPERTVATAMRGCRSDRPAHEIELTDDQVKRLIRAAIEKGHFSVLEHSSISFSISGISRVLTHQVVRHRIASYSQLSGRVVILPDWIKPSDLPTWVVDQANFHVQKLFDLAEEAKKQGVKTESVRYFLPFGQKTNIVWTMNLRECRHVFKLRSKLNVQREFRELISNMIPLAKQIAPTVFEDL